MMEKKTVVAGGWSFCGDMDSEGAEGFTLKPGCFDQEVKTWSKSKFQHNYPKF